MASIFAIHSSCWRRARSARKSRNVRSRSGIGSCRAGTSSSGSKPCSAANSPRTSSFMGVKRAGFAAPSSDSKYSSARFTPSQSKRAISASDAFRHRREALAIGQVHQLAPVQLGVLQDRGFLAPLRMIVPEFLADVRQFQPHVHQDRLAMAGFDQPAQVFVACGIRFVVVPAGHVQRADARLCASARRSNPGRRASGTRHRRTPTGVRCEMAAACRDR